MTTTSPRFGLTIPNADGSDDADLAALLRSLGLDVENKAPGVTALTTVQRTALTGAAMFAGRVVYDTDLYTLFLGDGTTWRALARLDTSGHLPMGGKKITGMADGTATTDAVTKGQLDTAMPVGAVISYAGASAPAGWALCDGSALSRSTYAALFAALGIAHGAGDGSTTFNLPDLRGRFALAAGQGAGGLSNRVLADKNGNTETHTLSSSEMPSHSHGASTSGAGGHSHTYSGTTGGVGDHTHAAYGEAGSAWMGDTWQYSDMAGILGASTLPAGAHSHSYSGSTSSQTDHTHPVTVNNQGGGTAHNNMPPFYVLTYIIKAT